MAGQSNTGDAPRLRGEAGRALLRQLLSEGVPHQIRLKTSPVSSDRIGTDPEEEAS